jgi:C1A family cysteine protease
MGKKVLALLLAVLTVGQSFSLTSFAVSDSNAQQSSTVSGESAVKISSSGSTKTFDIKLTEDDIQRLSSKEYLSSVSQAVYADGKNLNAIDLTKGYTLDSEKFDLRNVNGKSYTTPVRAQAPFGTCWSFATIAALESSILGAGLNGADGKKADTKTLDLSEKQIAWFSAMPLKDPSNPQNGEGQFIG